MQEAREQNLVPIPWNLVVSNFASSLLQCPYGMQCTLRSHPPYQGCLLNSSRMSYVLPYCQCPQCQLSNRIHLRRDTFIFHAATIVLTIETPSPLLPSSSLNFTFAYLGFNRAQSLLQRVYFFFHFQSILYHSNIGTHLLLPHFK